LYARVGEVVVEFGRLESLLRSFTSGSICPAIEAILSDSLLARTRFADLVEVYTFFVSYAIREAFEDEVLPLDDKSKVEDMLAALRKELLSLNDRRNNVVHSAYFEEALHHPGEDVKVSLIAEKPLLSRRRLDYSYDDNPFENVHLEIGALTSDITTAYQNLMTFDQVVIPLVNYVWHLFAVRTVQEANHFNGTKPRD
jgi:hypothetical protein